MADSEGLESNEYQEDTETIALEVIDHITHDVFIRRDQQALQNQTFSYSSRTTVSDLFDTVFMATREPEKASLLKIVDYKVPTPQVVDDIPFLSDFAEPRPAQIDSFARGRIQIRRKKPQKPGKLDTSHRKNVRRVSGGSNKAEAKVMLAVETADCTPLQDEEPDAVTLSHILSVATPRQLPAQEQDRRRSMLSYLEACNARAAVVENNKRKVKEEAEIARKKMKELKGQNYIYSDGGEIILINDSMPNSNISSYHLEAEVNVYGPNGKEKLRFINPEASKELPSPARKNKAKQLKSMKSMKSMKSTKSVNQLSILPIGELDPPENEGYTPFHEASLDSARLVEGVRLIQDGKVKEGRAKGPGGKKTDDNPKYRGTDSVDKHSPELPPINCSSEEIDENSSTSKQEEVVLPPLAPVSKRTKKLFKGGSLITSLPQATAMPPIKARLRKQSTTECRVVHRRMRRMPPLRKVSSDYVTQRYGYVS